ncbi:MAG: hypothetical protein CSA18_00850 [Deltaproteobacteria bacterium]|nr:MAG: hypothetical protein CSA18_00850 [Deltaproteobacteria bacterium]
MDSVLKEIKLMARKIVNDARTPSFYRDYSELISKSEHFFMENPVILRIQEELYDTLENNFGHGFGHAKKVAIEAGVLFAVEMKKKGLKKDLNYLFTMAQSAGLLHDICRKDKDHAVKGARYAGSYLPSILSDKADVDSIVYAIENHEAFCASKGEPPCIEALILSNSLYDSDKFRWGPDNFSHMIWAILEDTGITSSQFLKGYQRGIASLENIRTTFRSFTGKKYGPEFIDIGMEIGNTLYRQIKMERGFF